MTVPAVIYHLARRADWAAGQAAGEYRAPSLAAEGFIHASGDEAQLLRVAARLFAGHADLLALEVATARLDGGSPGSPGTGEFRRNLPAYLRANQPGCRHQGARFVPR